MNPPQRNRRLFVVVPAAGHSRRMGQSKLLMSFNGEPLICRLIRQLREAGLNFVSVLCRKDDTALQHLVREAGGKVVTPSLPPTEMKHSVQLLVEDINRREQPLPDDGWLLIPADHPIVRREVLARLLDVSHEHPRSIVIPAYQGKRGHPTIFPWAVTTQLGQIPANAGLNWLVRSSGDQVIEVDCGDPSVLWDLDTPEDFERIRSIIED